MLTQPLTPGESGKGDFVPQAPHLETESFSSGGGCGCSDGAWSDGASWGALLVLGMCFP